MKSFRAAILAWMLGLLCFLSALPAQGQLNDETLKLFQKLAPELDSGLREKFERAISENKSSIDFTPDEFIRFRKHPANPFAGLDEIDPYAEPGLIRLEFKIPSIRDRQPVLGERQHAEQLRVFQSAIARAAQSTVYVYAGENWVAMGTVVTAGGMIVTKASEVANQENLICRTVLNGESVDLPAKIFRVDDRNDIAMLQVNATNLTPIQFTNGEIVPGSFVITPDAAGQALVMGVVSTIKRSLIGVNQAYLGVRPINTAAGVELADITAGGSADLAGLKNGDIITRFGDSSISSVTELVNAIRLRQPGEQVDLEIRRGETSQSVAVVLAGRNMDGERAARYNMMNQFGTIPSERRDDFPMVFQHDSPLLPEFCGGPLVDCDGNVIGINIARSGRVASFAIGSAEMQTIVDQLLRENIASK